MLNILYPKVTEISGLFVSHGNDISVQDEKNKKRGDSPRKRELKEKVDPLGPFFTSKQLADHFKLSMQEADRLMKELNYNRVVCAANPTRKIGKYKVYIRTDVMK